ncbi:MAG: hypothetical protein IJT34_08940 [Butyrivibrio sp.]|nr:hypothetical protein [Butyrivibrio sp.]
MAKQEAVQLPESIRAKQKEQKKAHIRRDWQLYLMLCVPLLLVFFFN